MMKPVFDSLLHHFSVIIFFTLTRNIAAAVVLVDHCNNNEKNRYIACYKPPLMLCRWDYWDDDKAKRKHRPERTTLAHLGIPDLFLEEEIEEEENSSSSLMHVVGRLDRDSEGLLLLTTDGQFTAKVLSETCAKTYWALVEGNPTPKALDDMRQGGLEIRGATTRPPLSVQLLLGQDSKKPWLLLPPPCLGMDRPGTWLEIVLNEGRNRQVRRITSAAGHRTIRLVRVGIGNLHLANTTTKLLLEQPGDWAYIHPGDVLGNGLGERAAKDSMKT